MERDIQAEVAAVREFEKKMQENWDSIPQDFRDRTRQHMMDTSPKVKPPKRLFHGTAVTNKESITEQGIMAHKVFGQVYLCEREEDVKLFIHPPAVIYEVDTKKLLPKRFRISLDHNKQFYPCEAYAYYGDIPVEAIVGYSTHEGEESI